MFDHLGVWVEPKSIQPGDLIFFTHRGRAITHVGIYCGQFDEKQFYIHSPGINGHQVEINSLIYQKLSHLHHDQIYFSNPVGFKRLTINPELPSRRRTRRQKLIR